MDERAHHFPSQLSGGQQQQVAIARALDPELVGEVTNVMHCLAADGMTTADRVVFVADGVIAEQGAPEELFGNPQHPWTVQFLSKIAES